MKRYECDIAVIAAGPAGLAAAVTAAERGANVIILEKSNTTGGAANMGMGPLGVETEIQRENLIGITREEAFRKFMDYTHWRTDARLVREYIWKSADTIKWLQGMGVEFLGAYRYFPQSEATWHIVKSESGMGPRAASAMLKTLTDRAKELGVEILLETPAKWLEKNEEGRIVGVHAVDKNGEEVYVDCCATIIATGGFGDNPEMIKKYTPYEWGKDMFSFRIPGIAGDGIRMAWEVGAARTEMNMEVSYSTPSTVEYSCLTRVHMQPNLAVNLQGERFINEEIMANTTYCSNAIAAQKNGVAFSIIDDSIKQYYRRNGLHTVSLVNPNASAKDYDNDVKTALEKGDPYFFVADSIEELAEKMGVNKENFVKTVEEYNKYCQTRDELFCKDHRYMLPLVGPKFYALQLCPSGYGSLGGIKINYKTEVVNDEHEPIAGLYGAGTDVCSIYGDSYVFILPGNSMGFALNTGRIAGEKSVEYVTELFSEEE
ncbi:MAG: FAD-dependent oxidoreductase [Eubacteriales bacterium]